MASVFQTLQNVIDDVRSLTNKDSNTLTDAIMLRFANKHYLWLIRELNQGEYTNGEISTSDLVADQQEYPLPTDDTSSTYGGGVMQLLRVEAAIDGTHWYEAKKIDMLSQSIPANGNSTYDIYTKANPAYALFDNSIWFYPIPDANVTAGYKIYWIKRPNELAAATIPDLSKDFLGVLGAFIHSDSLTLLGRTDEATNKRLEAYQMVERAKQLNESAPSDFVMKPKKNIVNFR